MAAEPGIEMLIKKNGTTVGGLRNTSVSMNSSPIDVTNKDSSGQITLLAAAATEQIEISGDGVWTSDTMRASAMAAGGKLLTDMTVEFADNGGASNASLSGNFYLTSYQESGAFDGEVTYSLTLQSSGAWTYTAAA